MAYRVIIFWFMLFSGMGACDKAKNTPTPEPDNVAGTSDFNFTPSQGHVNTFVKISGIGFGNNRENIKVWFNTTAAVVKEVTDKYIITSVPVKATTGKITISINDYAFTSSSDFTITAKDLTLLTGSWVRKADFLGKHRSGVSTFANATTGFVTLGGAGDFVYKDTWQYQPTRDIWDIQTAFPGIPRFAAVSFIIGKKAYVVTGFAYFARNIKDFWEFDTETFIWNKKADFPGKERREAVGFAINNKGYVTTGITDYFEPELRDMWVYDPATDKWTQKADIPFASRKGAAGFSIGDKGYLGLGSHLNDGSEEGLNDFWEYEATTNKWTRKADYPEYINLAHTSFVLNQNGYIINDNQECWQYEPKAEQWSQKASLPEESGGVLSFVVQEKAYLLIPYVGNLYQFEP